MTDGPTTMTVERTEGGNRGRFRLMADGEALGEMTYSRATEDLVIVDHTETDERLRGQPSHSEFLVLESRYERRGRAGRGAPISHR